MKVVQISTQDFGGAGISAYRLHLGLRAVGVDSTMLVLNKRHDDATVLRLPDSAAGEPPRTALPPREKSESLRTSSLRWREFMEAYPDRNREAAIFSDPLAAIPLGQIEEIRQADVIHLHWVAGAVDYPSMVEAFRGKQLVWTLHDQNPFTGGCHYSSGCERFIDACGNCPILRSGHEDDVTRHIWQLKREVFQSLSPHIVTPSRWLGELAGSSSLFGGFERSVIPYGIELDVFHPQGREAGRARYGLKPDDFVVLFVSDSLSDPRKGVKYLFEALHHLKNTLGRRVIPAVVGRNGDALKPHLGPEALFLGPIVDKRRMAETYALADVFALPTLEDNLPNTGLESLAAGTPVVGFRVGGVPDIVSEGETGLLAPPRDSAALAEGIVWVMDHEGRRDGSLRRACRGRAEALFPLELQGRRVGELYERLTGKTAFTLSPMVQAAEPPPGEPAKPGDAALLKATDPAAAAASPPMTASPESSGDPQPTQPSRSFPLVTGTHVSGTGRLARILAAHPGLHLIQTPLTRANTPAAWGQLPVVLDHWYQHIGEHNGERFEPALRRLLDFRFDIAAAASRLDPTATDYPADERTMIETYAGFASASLNGQTPLVRDPFALVSLPWFAQRLGARPVMVVRHPAAFVANLREQGWRFGLEDFLDQPELHAWHPVPPQDLERFEQARAAGDHVRSAALGWKYLHSLIERYRREHPEWALVRYEDVARDPEVEAAKLLSALDLPPSDEVTRAARAFGASGGPGTPGIATHGAASVQAAVRSWTDRLSPGEVAVVRDTVAEVGAAFYGESEW